MAIEILHSYLVHPSKNVDEQPPIGGTPIPTSGKLFEMLRKIYDEADSECNIDISFNCNGDGEQDNAIRSLIINYVEDSTLTNGRNIAERLQEVTTNRSGLGLLFLLVGTEANQKKIVVSRFRADSGILAEEDEQSLSVEFLEKVFLKNTKFYKAAVYRGSSTESLFWDGKAVDKQINNDALSISDYWIKDFLLSDFKTTSAAGTHRLVSTLRQVMQETDDVSVKEESVAASRLAPSLEGKSTSIASFADKFGLSDETKTLLQDKLPSEHLYEENLVVSQK